MVLSRYHAGIYSAKSAMDVVVYTQRNSLADYTAQKHRLSSKMEWAIVGAPPVNWIRISSAHKMERTAEYARQACRQSRGNYVGWGITENLLPKVIRIDRKTLQAVICLFYQIHQLRANRTYCVRAYSRFAVIIISTIRADLIPIKPRYHTAYRVGLHTLQGS
jgi:hypothetical protein